MEAKEIAIGMLAHVDAGKTTLSEGILYLTGSIRKLGRVDHGNAFLDTDGQERARGITIFSKQARFSLGDKNMVLLDTPGHVDFSAEMERTLQVLDYAILVISGADGVQSHTATLWSLLKRYKIAVFIFVNKMDQAGADREKVLEDMQKRLDPGCLDFEGVSRSLLPEQLAECREALLEEYLETGNLKDGSIARAIAERAVFPCYFGSALKLSGVEEFLGAVARYSLRPVYPEEFGAKVFKIAKDPQGSRLTHMKITGGSLKVKALLTGGIPDGDDGLWQEKADQIRLYSGEQFTAVQEVFAGMVCAVTGLDKTRPGDGLGADCDSPGPVLEPVVTYRIGLPSACDPYSALLKLRQLEEEDPQLHIAWDEQAGEIRAQLMGEIEIEVLKQIILDRFGMEVEFGAGTIVYKETILEPVIGRGHFEPLRHYAEVHLLLEPGEPGSGLQFASSCSEDDLDRSWQHLILSQLAGHGHRGVLIGAEITDMKITLIAGKAHVKHTEGGDFRQAAFRALRQGLKKAKSVLLEPVYAFSLEVQAEHTGRAMSDIQRMGGSFDPPIQEGDATIIRGNAPVSAMNGYQAEVASYTKGRGRLFYELKGYEPCRDGEVIAAEIGYDAEKDPENPTGSIFCSNGGGYFVPWDEADAHMHADSGLRLSDGREQASPGGAAFSPGGPSGEYDEKELEAIFTRTYGQSKREGQLFHKRPGGEADGGGWDRYRRMAEKAQEERDRYLLVDGYNIIFAWDELKELAEVNLGSARDRLADILSNYQGYRDDTLILVFDAYKVKGGQGSVIKHDNIYIIYTKEAETADQYIEKAVHQMGRKNDVTVATSDNLEQTIIWGDGAGILSAQSLKALVEEAAEKIRRDYLNKQRNTRNFPFQKLNDSDSSPK